MHVALLEGCPVGNPSIVVGTISGLYNTLYRSLEQCNKTQQQNTYLKLSGPKAACAFECLFRWQAIETLVALENSGSSS